MTPRHSWAAPKEEVDFFDLKGALQAFFDALRLSNYQFVAGQEEPFLHPGKSCRILCREDLLGFMGEIHPEVAQIFELKQKIYLFEMNFDLLVKNIVEKRNFRPLPKFPASTKLICRKKGTQCRLSTMILPKLN